MYRGSLSAALWISVSGAVFIACVLCGMSEDGFSKNGHGRSDTVYPFRNGVQRGGISIGCLPVWEDSGLIFLISSCGFIEKMPPYMINTAQITRMGQRGSSERT